MKKLFTMYLTAIGALAASAAYTGCIVAVIDEPTMSKKMIER